MKYVIIVTTMRTRKARFDRNGTDQLNTLKRKETKMLSNAKKYIYTSLSSTWMYSREYGPYYNLNKEINYYLLFYSLNKAGNVLQQVLDSDNNILDHVNLLYQTSSLRFLSKTYNYFVCHWQYIFPKKSSGE